MPRNGANDRVFEVLDLCSEPPTLLRQCSRRSEAVSDFEHFADNYGGVGDDRLKTYVLIHERFEYLPDSDLAGRPGAKKK